MTTLATDQSSARGETSNAGGDDPGGAVRTTGQKMALEAYKRINDRSSKQKLSKEFRSFAREFPSLVHSCGLAQAVAFALAKGGHQLEYADDLAGVLEAAVHRDANTAQALANQTRSLSVIPYLRLSRDALAAAVWLKRYVEAIAEPGS